MTTITLSEGTSEKIVEVGLIHIPNVENLIQDLYPSDRITVLELWRLCHDLKRHIEKSG